MNFFWFIFMSFFPCGFKMLCCFLLQPVGNFINTGLNQHFLSCKSTTSTTVIVADLCVVKRWGTVLMILNSESTRPERVKNTSSEFHPAYFNTRSSAYFPSATASSVKPARRLNLDKSGIIHSEMHGNLSPARAFCWHVAATAGRSRCKSSLQCSRCTPACESSYV